MSLGATEGMEEQKGMNAREANTRARLWEEGLRSWRSAVRLRTGVEVDGILVSAWLAFALVTLFACCLLCL